MGDILGSLISTAGNVYTTERTNQANKQLAEYSYSKDLEMWNKQNAYNSPVEQMKRYEAAGLNKNLIYGQGSSGNAVQIPKYSAPHLEKPDIHIEGPTISDYTNLRMNEAQVDNVRANTQKIQEQTLAESMRNKLQNMNLLIETEAMAKGWKRNERFSQYRVRQNEPELKYWERAGKAYDAESKEIMLKVLEETKHELINQTRLKTSTMRENLESAKSGNMLKKYGIGANDNTIVRAALMLADRFGLDKLLPKK